MKALYLNRVFTWGLCFLAFFPSASYSEKVRKPNLLFIITDDQRFDMMGNMTPYVITPEMDRLAKEGVRFEKAFVTTPICAASRASMLTGAVERSHRYTFYTPALSQKWVENSYPVQLRKAGYNTVYIGKFGVQLQSKKAMDQMFDHHEVLKRTPYFKTQADGSVRHLTDITGDRAIDFIAKRADDQPWMMCLAFNAPHAEDNDSRQYIWPDYVHHLYQDLKLKKPALSEPSFYQQLPEFLRDGTLNRERWHWRFDPWPRKNKGEEMTKGYFRMISAIDHNIGRVRKALEQRGAADNTVIVMIGDNGTFLGERGYAEKYLPYELSIHVPLLYFDPRPTSKMVVGLRPKAIVANIDVPVTLLDLAGAEIPDSMQGRSLVELTQKKGVPADWRSDLWIEHLMMLDSIRKHEGVRTEQFKYSRYFEAKPVLEELYDLENDPMETRNLIHDHKYAYMAERLRKRTDELRAQYGGVFRPDPETVKRAAAAKRKLEAKKRK
ncbi:MAG: sulfatase-like hydrolase/transferase [Verrucomicrobiales bacterium]|nr:sulfatase-like hydrolase/transferase [Verrucomicrobiales bacterium]